VLAHLRSTTRMRTPRVNKLPAADNPVPRRAG
jgi:hypothetical protein